jgi:phage tail-like protein
MTEPELRQLLPGIFQRTLSDASPLRAMLGAMEELHAPDEEALDQVDSICDPSRTPDRFVPFLAHWVDLERIFLRGDATGAEENPISTGLGRLRELVATAAYLAKRRGTREGLRAFLETALGATGVRIEEAVLDDSGRQKPFHIRVSCPRTTEVHRALIQTIIEVERPAYVTWELVFSE